MNDHSHLRVIIDPPQAGPVNMATDEAILQAVQARQSPPTLRFYQWDPPTISLGYFQQYEEVGRQDEAVRQLAVVRRQTGGGAILHDDELTYSLVLPLDMTSEFSGIESLYRLVHDAYQAALLQLAISVDYRGGQSNGNTQRGPFFCFARLHSMDLIFEDCKLLGSAQRRLKQAVLQHGSLMLGRRFVQQPAAALKTATNGTFDLDELITIVMQIIAAQLQLTPEHGKLAPHESRAMMPLIEKYGSEEWTMQR